ncbi:MAG: hypothetical protein K2O85_06005, partial [Helicobacter sp.]|nr:hypothetical protein [Helicobacter sp.]
PPFFIHAQAGIRAHASAGGRVVVSNGQGGGGNHSGEQEQQRQNERENDESTLEELQMKQEMAQEIGINSRTWNTFGLQAYKNSDSVMQKLRFLELTLTPKYA